MKSALHYWIHRGLTLMSGNYLVDTNVIILLLRGDARAVELFNQADNIFVPSIVAGELFYGAQNSSRKQENRKIFLDFLSQYEIVGVDFLVAQEYGEIKSQLKGCGVTIPENDLWIAAVAKSKQYTLISFDGHFTKINGLQVVS